MSDERLERKKLAMRRKREAILPIAMQEAQAAPGQRVLKKKTKKGTKKAGTLREWNDIIRADAAPTKPADGYAEMFDRLANGPKAGLGGGWEKALTPEGRDAITRPVEPVDPDDEDEVADAPTGSRKTLYDDLSAEEREAVDWYIAKKFKPKPPEA